MATTHSTRRHAPVLRRTTAVGASALLLSTTALATAAPGSAVEAPPSQIAWSQFVDRQFTTARIVVAGEDGKGLRPVSSPGPGVVDLDPVWSPDGSSIAFERDLPDRAELVTVRADGTGERVVDVGCQSPCDAVIGPTWSADGSRLVFTRVYGPYDQPRDSARSAVLWTAEPDGSDVRRLSEPGIDGQYEDYRARYSPDGSYLIFVRVDNAAGRSAIFRMDSDGGDVRQLTPWDLRADTADLSPATSGPTEDLVVFESYGHGGLPPGVHGDVETVPTTCLTVADCTARIENLTRNGDGPANSMNPTWSPDGSRIAFVDFVHPDGARNLRYADILTMDATGRDRRRVSHSPTWDFRPDW